MKWAERSTRLFDRFLDLMVFLAGVLLVFVTVVVCIEVATRYFFNYPMGWVIEISSYILLFITFMVAAWVLKEEGHVSMDFIIGCLDPKKRSIINAFTSLLSCAVCVVLTFFGARVTWDLYKTKYFTPTMLELPKFPLIAIIALGSCLLLIQFIRRTKTHMGSLKGETHGEKIRVGL